jgi:valyl-tRNA synthetase
VSVATTRPETLFGDTAVAVHPDDDRYRELVGREAVLPFIGRRLPIISDEAVEPDFGTGAVKITPAHDFDDYAVAQRHGLPMLSILDEDARLTDGAGKFAGMDRYDARAAVVAQLGVMGDLESERPHQMVIGRCDRCGTVIEPRLSVQWFVRVKPLADRALASVREGRTRILPDHFAKVYAHWMENIHDWAVGRQLWWGHRIPAWYCPDGHITVTDAEGGPDACATCGRKASELTQETDIFDTWFSSGLWPFSTLGWPDQTSDLHRFYPTSVMETAYEILFFWVARMMMLGLFCTDVEPFHTVYLHGLVRDPYGAKMSKTKGNVVDPLEMVDEVGADALRFALVGGNSPGVDQRLTEAKVAGGRNFTNKLWNAARFVLASRPEPLAEPEGEPSLPERWVRSRLAEAAERATSQLDGLELAGYVAGAYEVAWSDYCDWFLEMAKIELRRENATPGNRARTWRTCAESLADLLRLLHPVMPFVSEEVWARLYEIDPAATHGEPLLMSAAWPAGGARDQAAEADIGVLMTLVRGVRNLRAEAGASAAAWLPLTVVPSGTSARAAIEHGLEYLGALARVRPIDLRAPGDDHGRPDLVASTGEAAVWLGGETTESGDASARRAASEEHLQRGIERLRDLLAGEFATRAPAEVVARERVRLAELESELRLLTGG